MRGCASGMLSVNVVAHQVTWGQPERDAERRLCLKSRRWVGLETSESRGLAQESVILSQELLQRVLDSLGLPQHLALGTDDFCRLRTAFLGAHIGIALHYAIPLMQVQESLGQLGMVINQHAKLREVSMPRAQLLLARHLMCDWLRRLHSRTALSREKPRGQHIRRTRSHLRRPSSLASPVRTFGRGRARALTAVYAMAGFRAGYNSTVWCHRAGKDGAAMARPQFITGDRVRVVTSAHPNMTHVGIIRDIIPAPDTSGHLMYAIQVADADAATATILVVDSPRILLMEYATGERQTSD